MSSTQPEPRSGRDGELHTVISGDEARSDESAPAPEPPVATQAGSIEDVSARVLDVARSVLEDLDVEVVLERALVAARDVTGARYAALGVLDASRMQLGRFLTLGIDEGTRRLIGPLPTGRGVLGELIRDPAPLRIADVGSHPMSYGFPVGHPPMSSFLGVPIMVGGQTYGHLYLTEKTTAGEFSDADERAVVLLADFAGLGIDHAQRYSGSESQRQQLRQTNQALDATMQITRALGGETDLQAILELVAKRGRALVSARVLVIELLDGDELILAAGAGELPAGLLGQRVPLENTVASAALRAGQTQRLSDRLSRARFEQYGVARLGVPFDEGLVVPLVFRARGYGVLVALDHRDEGGFTDDHQRLLEAFAASAATAVATAQSAHEERQRQRLAAAEAERARWARELHDETLQSLATLRLVLAAGERSQEPEKMAGALRAGIKQLETDIATLRALITELRPAALDHLGVDAAVRGLADRMARAGLEVDVSVELAWEQGPGSERLIPELETAVYRLVQEALTNATRHGHAGRAVVEIADVEDRVNVTIRDDGAGFDPATKTNGFGLLGMRERVELLDGTLTITSAPGEGTTVVAVLPARHRHTGAR